MLATRVKDDFGDCDSTFMRAKWETRSVVLGD